MVKIVYSSFMSYLIISNDLLNVYAILIHIKDFLLFIYNG